MVQSVPEPESYVLRSTTYVPNNMFPVLVYRSVLPQPIDEKTTTDLLEQNEYERKGLWTGTPVHHFHPNTHECYAVISGFSIMHVGRGQLDHLAAGQQLTVKAGDVVVMPAGTAHMNVSMSDDYLFVGVYPKGSPRWRSERCDNAEIMDALRAEIAAVAMPTADPVSGSQGRLMQLWRKS